MAQSVDTQQDSSDNTPTNNCSTSTANNQQTEQDGQHSIQNSISECLKKPLSIHSPSFEPPLHVLQQTIRQERVLFQQVNSPLTDEFKTCVVRLRGLPWTSTVQDIAEFFSEFKLAKKEQSKDDTDLSSSEIQPTIEQPSTCIVDSSSPSQLTYAAIVSMGVSSNEQITDIEQVIQQPIKQYKISVDTAKDMDIILMLNYFGKSTGEAYVRFESEEELEKARKTMDKKNLGSRYIEIFKSTIEEMEHSRRVLERNLKNLNNSKILKMRNVPFSATEDEIETFFSGLTIATVQSRNQAEQSNETRRRKVYFVLNPMNGKRTGEVFVEFTCHDQMLQAAKRNKEKIRNRYIELFHSSISELRASQYYIQQQQQQNYFPYQHITRPRISGVQNRKSNFIVKIEGLPTSFEENEIAELFNGLSLSEAGIHLIFGEDECSTGEAFVEFVNEESFAKALEQNDTTISSVDENNVEQQNTIKVIASDRAEMLSVCGIEEEEEEQDEEEEPSNNTTLETTLDQTNHNDYSKRRFNYNNNFAYPMVYYVPSYTPYYVNPYFQQQGQSFRNNLDPNTDSTIVKQPFKYKLFEHPERTLKMRGLPFSSTEKEIAEFFAGYDFEEDSIRFKMDFKRNRQTGICYIRFRTKTEAERAANERNRCNIGDRYIELFTITPKT
ncbi:predicted protein [Naegleria gruberi]|uniref:Predicted protein n=1 Tax=Naegleria gruberi TaxID=5762 RepID=D2VX27_NAEGR|nr:uncharacterized protein NAEGRDRAFT_81544 [Naegleria gruberi]EFC38547.1 predicted protein [Naegleria gruberi]|eukprot:XP_002671291.1 predicted protein [Naegleria gruberi strain NEG-M]